MVKTFIALFISCLVASLLHEATHYSVAYALARRPWFDVADWAVYWHAPARAPTRGDYAVAVAPVVVGIVAGAVAVLGWGIVWWAVPGWYLYTLHGAITNDLEFPQTDTAGV